MKNFFKRISTKIWIIVCAILNAVLITANILGQTYLHDLFITALGKRNSQVFGSGIYYESDYKDKDDALEKSNKVNEKINEEGIVMLKNEDNALPLKKGSNISVFGKNSVNLAYGGSGSGAFKVDENTPTIYQSLKEAGYNYNEKLKSFYESSKSGSGRPSSPSLDNGRSSISGFETGETPYSSYSEEIKSSYSQYSDAAIVVFSRIGGESYDLPRTMKDTNGAFSESDHYLELDKNEQDLLVNVCNSFSKVIVVINSSTQMELGFLDDIDDNDSTIVEGMKGISSKIQAALWIGGPGYSGILALGRVINGEVTPSGRTVDTYQRDFTQDPTYQNFGDYMVDSGNTYLISDGSKPSVAEHFVDYEEGIYVGYRYYETRGSIEGETWYKNHVVYPFGYGLSYTTFEWKLKDANFKTGESLTWDNNNDKKFDLTVTVKNTGDTYSGKDVVQVYISAPYTDGGIEKSSVQLVGFAKTKLLAPGEEQDVTVSFDGYDFASYDYADMNNNGFRGYELDSGHYDVKIMENAHEEVLHTSFELTDNVKYEKDTTTGTKVENLYDDVSFEENYGMESVMSRSNFEGTFPVNEVLAGSNTERTITPEFLAKIKSTDTNNPLINDTTVQYPTQATVGSPNGTKQVYDLIQLDENNKVVRDSEGTIVVDYDDPRWSEYLDILTIDEMMDFEMKGAFQTTALQSIGLLPGFASDGPVGFVYFMAQLESASPVYKTCSYASECVIAATWNVELAYAMGESIGNEGIIGNQRGDGRPYSGWYAPAVNLHRSPFGGRNFEYYSEDPVLSGKLATEVIKGCRSKGVYCNFKHFAVNEQETNRSGVCTWFTEQALRELYLKPFEIAIKEGGSLAIMSSFNRLGSLWTGGDYRLLTTILRNEWGFKGMVICDFNTEPFMDTKQMAYAGGDLNLATLPKPWTPTTAADYQIVRQCAKNIIYTTIRSNNMNGCGEGGYYVTYYAWWEVTLFFGEIGMLSITILWGLLCFYLNYRKNNQTTIVEEKEEKKQN